jgi:hypothetical protein
MARYSSGSSGSAPWSTSAFSCPSARSLATIAAQGGQSGGSPPGCGLDLRRSEEPSSITHSTGRSAENRVSPLPRGTRTIQQ